jgi:hypothetical protein
LNQSFFTDIDNEVRTNVEAFYAELKGDKTAGIYETNFYCFSFFQLFCKLTKFCVIHGLYCFLFISKKHFYTKLMITKSLYFPLKKLVFIYELLICSIHNNIIQTSHSIPGRDFEFFHVRKLAYGRSVVLLGGLFVPEIIQGRAP